MSDARAAIPRRKWIGHGAMGLYVIFLLVMLTFTYRACADYWEIEACIENGDRWNPKTNVCDPR